MLADRARVLADQHLAHAVDGGADARPAVLLEFRPADSPSSVLTFRKE